MNNYSRLKSVHGISLNVVLFFGYTFVTGMEAMGKEVSPTAKNKIWKGKQMFSGLKITYCVLGMFLL